MTAREDAKSPPWKTGTIDADLVAAAVRGERAAVATLTQAFLPRVYGLSVRIVGRRDLAEEATQEAFVRVLRALPRLREPERLPSWVLTIAANVCRDLLRKERRAGVELAEEPPAPEPEPAPASGRLRRQTAIADAVQALKPKERELFLLHTVEGVELRSIARARRTTEDAVKSKLHRIRAKVRERAAVQLRQMGDSRD